MKEKYLYIDSSDEEREKNVVKNVTKINYNNYLLTNILNIKSVHNADEFKIKLGLILHNLADRLFRSLAINNIYQKIKGQKLSLNENTHKKILADIKMAFNKKLTQLFTDDNKENKPSDKDYIQLFNFVFNKKINLPEIFTLKKNIKITDAKKILLKELQIAKINLKPLYKNPLNIELEANNFGEILACSQIVNRNNKNKIKYLTSIETNNHTSSTIYNLPNTELDITQGLNNFAEQLAHLLFIVEMQRNNATLFTAPIFLELIAKDAKYLEYEKFFPMSAKTAVSQARGVIKDYSKELPNTHNMDYDTTNVKNGYILLKREGGIFVEWLNIVMGNSVLNYITQIFDAVTLVEIISNKKINRISIQELQNFLDDIKKIDNCPHNLLTALAESLNNLIPNFGKRSEQYLNLDKENLLKKNILTEDIKDLIEVTYYIFQETLPKLESFLLQAQKKLAADIEKILPEILTVLCEKIKEWYNIKVPEYITANPYPKDVTDNEALKDITTSIYNNKSVKISFPNPFKRKEADGNIKNDNNKVLKLLTEKEIDNFLNIIYEELPVIGEDSSYSL